jgi:hypothetical protein
LSSSRLGAGWAREKIDISDLDTGIVGSLQGGTDISIDSAGRFVTTRNDEGHSIGNKA